MKKWGLRFLAMVLCMVLLAGCQVQGGESETTAVPQMQSVGTVSFASMAYVRPDMAVIEETLAEACEAAAGEDFSYIMDRIYAFYDVYDGFYTNYALADIHYCQDLTDSYWEAEYNFCMDNSARVDAAMEELYYALAKSPCRKTLESRSYFGAGYFDAYEGENAWDGEFTALLEQEAALQSQYYDLANRGAAYEMGTESYFDACFQEMAELLIELIRLRHDIAAYWGYSDYSQFATDFYYYRDYTVAQSEDYLEEIRVELVELYRQVNESGIWDIGFGSTTEERTYEYVQSMAQDMGGIVQEAFKVMARGGLYDIKVGENKYPASFEIYLTSYGVPFVFMDPYGTTYDHLTFAHEFGHFCCDYASYGSYAGVDVLEVFSQGMEYLSLCYGEASGELTRLKLADSLCLYVEQGAFASFELQMYALPEEVLTVERLTELYHQVAKDYGFESIGYDPREFVTINHYYTNPLYIISYVVSNDAAMQLYQMEQAEPGQGLARLKNNLDTEEAYFLAFVEQAGLESPFAPGRLQAVKETYEQILK